jgi:Flp pilus assembly protein TadG
MTKTPGTGEGIGQRTGLSRARAIFGRCILHGDSGTSLVEFAVTAFVLVLLLFGVIQTCLVLYTYNYVSDAARMATRYASVRGSSCTLYSDCGADQAQILSYLQGVSYPAINSSKLQVTATWLSPSAPPGTTWTACGSETGCNGPSDAVQVKVSYPVAIFVPKWKGLTLTVSSSSQMVISN